MKISTCSPDQTKDLAFRLAFLLQEGDVLALFGNLGAGKTCFTQGLALGLDVRCPVKSPTFQIIREYRGRLPLYHFDLYRLGEAEELYEIGYEDYVYGSGVTVIEWPSRAEELLPEERLEIHLKSIGSEARELEFLAFGERAERIVKEMGKDAGFSD